MNKKDAIQKQIDEIMDHFPFEKVHAQMKAEKWTWASSGGSVPEIYEIRQCARERLWAAAEFGMSSTGGFSAHSFSGEDESGKWVRLSLYFGHEWSNDEATTYTE